MSVSTNGNEENGQQSPPNGSKPNAEYWIVVHIKPDKSKQGTVEPIPVITDILSHLKGKSGPIHLRHFETRIESEEDDSLLSGGFSCILKIICSEEEEVHDVCENIGNLNSVTATVIVNSETVSRWIPRHISDLDRCANILTKFQPELQTDHPGFHDMEYRKRRQQIVEAALNYRYGNPLPDIEYNENEIGAWRKAYTSLKALHPTRACKEYIQGFSLLERHAGFTPDRLPRMQDVSNYLERTSGFRLRPAAGLVSPRDFLANFAFRVFPCTQYTRHHSRPMHTPEPDCIHEYLGHMPLLTNRKFADFSHQIGLASIGASDEVVTKLATLYWFTVEFGMCHEDDGIRALGAALLSSYGELENAFSDKAEKREFDPKTTALQTYDDVGYQPVLFVCQSIETMEKQLRDYTNSLFAPRRAVYDPYTQKLEMLLMPKLRRKLIDESYDNLKKLSETFPHEF
ncbi:unnamed protein product [Calicophoron daubneyi]|uniref:Biopterin-dependent aromatic amino acid hydroxylase family profile domain-containing protein n=1 Tax=Calicophoron daubneyi TaxID=300641 RepID=A0AAV2T8J2_CALDB